MLGLSFFYASKEAITTINSEQNQWCISIELWTVLLGSIASSMWRDNLTIFVLFAWLIKRTFSANEYYFSLTINQPTVLLAMTYQPNKPK